MLLHQPSSLRDSKLLHEDQSYPDQSASAHLANFGLRLRAPNGAILLSSLARSSSEGDLLASTIVDISTASSDSGNSEKSTAAEPRLDLAHYLVSSKRRKRNLPLNKELTCLNISLSGEWEWNYDTPEIFDRGGAYISGAEDTASSPSPPPELITPRDDLTTPISTPIPTPLLHVKVNMPIQPGATVSLPLRTLSPLTPLQPSTPFELQYPEHDPDRSSSCYVTVADLTAPPFTSSTKDGPEAEDVGASSTKCPRLAESASGLHSESGSRSGGQKFCTRPFGLVSGPNDFK
ncbi:hypothetical protein B0H14DRAFT_3531761 [Mycena olivaceomarginata]|nr:hypothetical protein B0H14DRAFT_3531761 [Mycena olivaceomarginata]